MKTTIVYNLQKLSYQELGKYNVKPEEETKPIVEPVNTNVEPSNTNVEPIQPSKKKYVRKCPNELAKNYEIGFTKVSVNDGKTYEVVEVSGEKRTMKRWVLQNTFQKKVKQKKPFSKRFF